MRQDMQQRPLMARLLAILQRFLEWLLVILRQPYEVAEFFLISIIAAWAVPLLVNPRIFVLSPIMYAPMAEQGTPLRWGVRALALIMWWIAARYLRNTTLRAIAQVSLIWWFFFLAGMFFMAGGVTFGFTSHAVMFVFAVWVLWRFAAGQPDRVR